MLNTLQRARDAKDFASEAHKNETQTHLLLLNKCT